MSTTLLTLAVDEIGPHPKNVRRDDTPDAELIASVEAQGILQPLVVVPAPEEADTRFWLLMGHRRLAAAQAARLMDVPAIVREDLTSEAEQIEAMLVENGRRADLSATEEADAYQQLTLLGVDVDEISRTTGRAKSTVRSRLKIAAMATKAKDALHERQITLEDAERITTLEEDHELHAAAVDAIGTPDFGWKVNNAISTLKLRRQYAETEAKWQAAGLSEVDEPEGGWKFRWQAGVDQPVMLPRYDTMNATAGVDFDGYTFDRGGEPLGVVSAELRAKIREAEEAVSDESETDEEREERLAREQRNAEAEERRLAWIEIEKRHEAAGAVRRQTIRDLFAGVKLTKQQTAVLRSGLALLLHSAEVQGVLIDHDGLQHDGNIWSLDLATTATHLAEKTGAGLLTTLALVSINEAELSRQVDYLDMSDEYDRARLDASLAYLDAIEAIEEHPWSEPDAEWRDAVINVIDGGEGDDGADEGE